jgi:hypothetical protein
MKSGLVVPDGFEDDPFKERIRRAIVSAKPAQALGRSNRSRCYRQSNGKYNRLSYSCLREQFVHASSGYGRVKITQTSGESILPFDRHDRPQPILLERKRGAQAGERFELPAGGATSGRSGGLTRVAVNGGAGEPVVRVRVRHELHDRDQRRYDRGGALERRDTAHWGMTD